MKSLILALAAARLTQLVVDDEITAPIRAKIERSWNEASPGSVRETVLGGVDTGINCHACSSIWAGGGVLVAEQAGPVGRFLVRTLALSQAALAVKSVIERIDR